MHRPFKSEGRSPRPAFLRPFQKSVGPIGDEMNPSQGPMAQVRWPVPQQMPDGIPYRKPYPKPVPVTCSFEGCSTVIGHLSPGVKLAPNTPPPVWDKHARRRRKPAPELRASTGIRRDVLGVFMQETHRHRGGGYSRASLYALLRNPSKYNPVVDKERIADPDSFPLWNGGNGVEAADLRGGYGEDVPREVHSVSLSHALAVTEGSKFLPDAFGDSNRGGISESSVVQADFDGPYSPLHRTDSTQVKRSAWFLLGPNASHKRKKAMGQLFFKTLWRRAQHTKDPRRSYERWLSIIAQFFQERLSVKMIVERSHGKLTVPQVRSVLQRVQHPPKELRI